MIIWTRRSLRSFLGFGIGGGPASGALVAPWTAADLGPAHLVHPRLDRLRQVATAMRRPGPGAPDRRVQTHEVIPALDPRGRRVRQQQRSTLFLAPATARWIPLGVVAMALAVPAFFTG